MLLQPKQIAANDIVTMKLSTGDELLTKIVSIESDGVTINKPVILSLSLNEKTGQPGIQMLPFFIIGADPDASLPIKNIHIITMVKCNSDIKSSYLQSTTGLSIPKSNY